MLLTYSMFVGSIIAVYGSLNEELTFIKIWRGIDGFCGDLNDVMINSAISYWFKGKFMSFAVSLASFMNSMGISCGTYFSIRIFERYRDLSTVYVSSGIIGFICSLCGVVFQFFDLKREKVENKNKKKRTENETDDGFLGIGMIKGLNNWLIWGMI